MSGCADWDLLLKLSSSICCPLEASILTIVLACQCVIEAKNRSLYRSFAFQAPYRVIRRLRSVLFKLSGLGQWFPGDQLAV